MKDEVWAEIKGFPNYWISNHGRVLNHTTGQLRICCPDKDGYLRVTLYNREGRHTKIVHRLVASAFIPNPCNYPEVNHIDKDRANHCFKNLEWVTSQMNNEHSKAKCYTFRSPEGKKVEVFNLNQFSKDNKLTQAAIYRVFMGTASHHKRWTKWNPGDIEGIVELPKIKTYTLMSPNGEKVEVPNLNQFAKDHSLNTGSIYAVANELYGRKNHKGWTRWEEKQ